MENKAGWFLKEGQGGLNWGYCADAEKSSRTAVSYSGYVVTSNCPDSHTKSEVLIKLIGEEGRWSNFKSISANGYDKSGHKISISDFNETDVGRPQKLQVKIKGQTSWRCQAIYILKDGIETKFECLKKLYPCTGTSDASACQLESTADGNFEYKVAIKTGDHPNDSNKGPIHIILKGDKKISQEKIFSDEEQQSGQIVETSIMTEDLGNIKGFKLILLGPAKWKPAQVTIQAHDSSEKKEYDLIEAVLIYPGDQNTYELGDTGSSNSGGDDGDDDNSSGEGGGSSSGGSGGSSGGSKSSPLDVNDPYGGFIEFNEKSKIIKLMCDDTLEESADSNKFGPKYPTKKIETMSVLVRCPSHCSEQNSIVLGVGLHPTKSPICISAIVDNAMSLYGGIMQLTITSGLKAYTLPENFPKKIDSIVINEYNTEDSMKSYSLSKVDNIDLVEKDFRIIDSDGNLSNIGRLDIRLGGEWGSVCAESNTKEAANVICKTLEYKGGNWLTKEDGRVVCGSYNGKNYCGKPLQKIHFSNIDCVDGATEFDNCNKSFADRQKCDHSKDTMIHCFNENYDNAKQVPNNNVRLDAIKKDGKTTTGRLELAKNQNYLPVCGANFEINAANLACKLMGYESGETIENPEIKKKFQFDASDKTTEFSVMNLTCGPTITSIDGCIGEYNNINCTHDNDVVIKCKGENGDPSGVSQFERKVINGPPKLGKLGISTINADCALRGSNPKFRGNPGSIYKVCCPNNCLNEPGTIWGDGIYSDDSSICLAAIHDGIYSNERDDGCFLWIKHFGIKYTKSFHIITSYESEYKGTSSFTLAKLNSGWNNMAKKFNQDNAYGSFLELPDTQEYTTENYINNYRVRENIAQLPKYDRMIMMDHLFPSSFLELKGLEETLPAFMFSFIENDDKHVFYDKDNYIISESKMNKVNEFSLVAKFKMTKFSNGSNNMIFSFGGPEGFNIYINSEGNLIAGQMTNPALALNLDYPVPLENMISLYLVQNNQGCWYSLRSKSNATAKTKDQFKLDMPTDGFIGIGRSSSDNIQPFQGRIEFIEIYPQAFDKTSEYYDAIKKSINIRKKANAGRKPEFTTDDRKCIMSCSTDDPGTGNPPPGAALDKVPAGGPAVNDNSGGDVTIICEGQLKKPLPKGTKCEGGGNKASGGSSSGGSSGKDDPSSGDTGGDEKCGSDDPNCSKGKPNTGGTDNISTGGGDTDEKGTIGEPFNIEDDTTLENAKFDAYRVDKKFFKVICPKISQNTECQIYGYGIYRANSSICCAALQWGSLLPNVSGMVMVYVEGVQAAYHGSTGKYDIKSDDVLENEQKLSFHVDPIGNMKKLSCKDTLGNSFQKSGTTDMIVTQCPQNCDTVTDEIYGGNISEEGSNCPGGESDSPESSNDASSCIYTDDSPICKAAIHCGILNKLGGFVKFQVQGEQPKFISQESFGINSKEKSTQVRSFSFVGDRAAIFANFKEDYKGDMSRNWVFFKTQGCINPFSNAVSFYQNDNFKDPEGKGYNLNAIKFDGSIYTKKPYSAASIIKKRDLEFANGIVQANIIITGLQPIFMFIRYNDDQNHIGLKIDNTNQNFNHEIYIKYQGVPKTLGSKHFPMELNRIYRYKFSLDSESVKVEVQDYKRRKYVTLFSIQISSLTRGTIAFGYNGKARKIFYIFGITISPFRKIKGADASTLLTWNKILDHAGNKKTIVKICRNYFDKHSEDYKRCVIPIFFCRYQCDGILPQLSYGILFNRCVRECESKAREALGVGDMKTNTPAKVEFKENQKVDFQPSSADNNSFFQGKIIKVEKADNGTIFVNVQWTDSVGQSSTNKVVSTSPNLFKCGDKLQNRTDCKEKQ